jgi:hypothetical protein
MPAISFDPLSYQLNGPPVLLPENAGRAENAEAKWVGGHIVRIFRMMSVGWRHRQSLETGRLNMTTIANAACLARLLFYLEPVNCSTKTIHA